MNLVGGVLSVGVGIYDLWSNWEVIALSLGIG